MKNKHYFYLFSAFLFSCLIEIVNFLWGKSAILHAQLHEKYYIGALLIFVFGGFELLSLYGLRHEVRKMKGKRAQHWKNFVEFVFIINCIGLPIYLIAFFVSRYWS
ncbi:MAG: hypothetical protein IIY94_02030 [Oscillospiraceae bacterium]|nr:hypothetical protein [Oscillospiraceae bacterium]